MPTMIRLDIRVKEGKTERVLAELNETLDDGKTTGEPKPLTYTERDFICYPFLETETRDIKWAREYALSLMKRFPETERIGITRQTPCPNEANQAFIRTAMGIMTVNPEDRTKNKA